MSPEGSESMLRLHCILFLLALIFFMLSIVFGKLGYGTADRFCMFLCASCIILNFFNTVPKVLDQNLELWEKYRAKRKSIEKNKDKNSTSGGPH